MTIETQYEQATALAARWGQQHLLAQYDKLEATDREELLGQILAVEYERLMGVYRRAAEGQPRDRARHVITPMTAIQKNMLSPAEQSAMHSIGMEAVRRGEYAVVTMAGGQGTRLGFPGPKGSYVVALDRPMSLFEVQLEQIRGLSREAGVPVPWYIMTSDQNHEMTVRFFAEHENFGYEFIQFFRQSSLPMMGMDGKLLMDTPHSIMQGPDGNGAIFRSLKVTGMAQDMERRGIRWFFVGNVDNLLLPCVDLLPIGIAVRHGVPVVSKSVVKRNPDEKAGIFCRIDGRPSVVEYTEISPALAHETSPDGSFVYGDAHISCTLFHTDVLRIVEDEDLPYHVAVKKATYVDKTGSVVTPDKENALKFEAFIFDIFPRCHDIAVLRVDRCEEFAPIKNAEGEDSPQTARELYLCKYAKP